MATDNLSECLLLLRRTLFLFLQPFASHAFLQRPSAPAAVAVPVPVPGRATLPRKRLGETSPSVVCHRIHLVHQRTFLRQKIIGYLCFRNRNDCFTKNPNVMKKALFVASMMLAMGTTVAVSAAEKDSLCGQISVEADYQTIDIKDLPQAVQDAVAAKYPELTVKEAAVEEVEGVKTYKVTLLDKDGVETVAVFGENGEEQK